MFINKKTPSERSAWLAKLKSQLKDILEEGQQIKNKTSEISTVSRFNIFKQQKMKYDINNGLNSVNKSLYEWENEYSTYKECLVLGPTSIFCPYVKLILSVFSILLNVFILIDL